MTNEDYQLEELENAAVNKSNNAKRIAAAAGLLAAGGAAGFAATNIPVNNPDEPTEVLTEEDLESVTDTGATQVHESEVTPQPVQQQPTASVTPPTPPAEDDVDVNFDKTTQFYDQNQNLIMTTEEGEIDGHKFQLVDLDDDMRADVLAYDKDGNGVYNEDEMVQLSGKDQISMGHATSQHDVKFVAINELEPEPYIEPIDIEGEKYYGENDIHNDFEDEKTGETYSYDYAENNEDYNNNGDVEPYSASGSDYAYEEDMPGDVKEESDYESSDLAENDTMEESFDNMDADSLDLV